LKTLEYLNLHGANVTDAGLQHLANHTSLKHLNLRDCKISDNGLSHLSPLTQLRTLDLTAIPGEAPRRAGVGQT
jgi:hypothetical protein